MVVLLNDFAHMVRKWKEKKFSKRVHNAEENDGIISLCIDDLRNAPTEAAFNGLVVIVLQLWRNLGEGDFANFFEKVYLSDKWKNWYMGATPAGVLLCLRNKVRH
jgi:hypothetical protein